MRFLPRKIPRAAASAGLALVLLLWLVDSAVDVTFFEPEKTFIESLLHPEPIELWMRMVSSSLILMVVATAAMLLRHKEKAEIKLRRTSTLLEELAVELSQKNEDLQQEIRHRREIERQLQGLAVTDQLTGIYNRRKFDEVLRDELRQEARYSRGLALIMLDIDYFKAINDSHGHAVGDSVLRELANLIRTSIRDADFLFRIGGEEFAIITFAAEDAHLETAAEKVRQAVAAHTFAVVGSVHISLGATRYRPDDEYDGLCKRADDALYQAKKSGRNQVVMA